MTVYNVIETRVNLSFIREIFDEREVYLDNEEEVRLEFRLQFTNFDIVNYIYGIVYQLYWNENKKLKSLNSLPIPYPTDVDYFWEYSLMGNKFRKINPIYEIEFSNISALNWGK